MWDTSHHLTKATQGFLGNGLLDFQRNLSSPSSLEWLAEMVSLPRPYRDLRIWEKPAMDLNEICSFLWCCHKCSFQVSWVLKKLGVPRVTYPVQFHVRWSLSQLPSYASHSNPLACVLNLELLSSYSASVTVLLYAQCSASAWKPVSAAFCHAWFLFMLNVVPGLSCWAVWASGDLGFCRAL